MVTFEQKDKKLSRLMLAMVMLVLVAAAPAWGQDASGNGGVAVVEQYGDGVPEIGVVEVPGDGEDAKAVVGGSFFVFATGDGSSGKDSPATKSLSDKGSSGSSSIGITVLPDTGGADTVGLMVGVLLVLGGVLVRGADR